MNSPAIVRGFSFVVVTKINYKILKKVVDIYSIFLYNNNKCKEQTTATTKGKVNTMKVLKKAEQKNVAVNKAYYTIEQLNDMLYNQDICHFAEDYRQSYELLESWEVNEADLRIFTNTIERLEVILDDYGYYTNVAITKKGFKIYIEL